MSWPGADLTGTHGYTWAGTEVRAYVVDSGVYAAHAEFEGRVAQGGNMTWDPDVSDPKTDPREEQIRQDGYPETVPCGGWLPDDANGVPPSATHGTAVASILGGNTVGVAKNATIVPVKVMNCWGETSKLAVIRGLDWVTTDMTGRTGRAVVSLSLGFREIPGIIDDNLCDRGDELIPCLPALEYQVNKLIGDYNIPVVSAAHNLNNGQCDISPARMGAEGYPTYYRPITVGGTAYVPGLGDQRWSCIDYPQQCGWTWTNSQGSNYGACVNIWAPALNLRVAAGSGPNDYRAPGQWSSGTSFSAPIVAGVIARLLEHYPALPASEMLSALEGRASMRIPMPTSFDPTRTNSYLVYLPRWE